MADNMSPTQRSRTMSCIRSSGNATTELRLLETLKKYGLKGWRRHQQLPGKPDFVFRDKRVAVFVDGCFWHGCRKCYRQPKSNVEYWSKKVARNKQRDKQVSKQLRERGWFVMRIKEHTLRRDPGYVARRIRTAIEDS